MRRLSRPDLLFALTAVLAAPLGGCWSSTTTARPAVADPGQTAFAPGEHVRGLSLLIFTVEDSRTGTAIAAISGADGDRLWRVIDAGARLEWCAPDGCRAVDPGPVDATFTAPLLILDPAGRGQATQLLTTWVAGQPAPSETESGPDEAIDPARRMPATAHYGVWVLARDGETMVHCARLPDGPRCRPAQAVDTVLGVAHVGGSRPDVVWAARDGLIVRCAAGLDAPTCQTAAIQEAP